MIKSNYSFIYGMLLAVGISLTAGCASDVSDSPDGGTGEATITLTVRDQGTTRVSNADDNSEKTENNELINNWIVYFVDRDGQRLAPISVDRMTPGYYDLIKGEIPKGHYTAYAFANFRPDAGITDKLKYIDKNQQPSEFGWLSGLFPDTGYITGANVPMAGYLPITITGSVNENFSIEVVRMLAKMEFSFTSEASHGIVVNNIGITPVNKGEIYMMPEYGKKPEPDTDNVGMPEFYETDKTETVTHRVNVQIDSKQGKPYRTHFYIKESTAASHPTGHFLISVDITRKGVGANGSDKKDLIYALTDNLTTIWRNDYILIPIKFTDLIPDVSIFSYPPIGGYPCDILEKENEYYASFSNAGRFEINPRLLNVVDGVPADRSKYSVSIEYDKNNTLFGELTHDETDGLWWGELKEGTAGETIVKITYRTEGYTSSRTVHIIRK